MDLRITLRTLAKQPSFCLTAILTLALGIGANTAIFSVFNAVILRPWPYRDPGRLVMVWQTRPDGRINGVAGQDYSEWIKQAGSFERLEGLIPQFYNVGGREDTVQATGARVSPGFFDALGVQPALGRGFAKDDDQPGTPRVAIVNYSVWQSVFASDRSVLGKPIELNGEQYILIGVMPKDFDFVGQGMLVWTPLIFKSSGEFQSNKMAVLGRLKPAVTLKQANREMQVVAKRLEPMFPKTNTGWSAAVNALDEIIEGPVRPALTALMVGVGLVLLIACTNVSNLLLARSDVRYKEVAVRSALGANRGRLMRQLLTETMLLACAGSLAGVALAWAGLRVLARIAAGQLPRVEDVGLDARVLLFTLGVTVATGLLFGLLPAHKLLGGDLQAALRESGRGSIHTRGGSKARNVLVVSEIALSLMLAIGATLMARSVFWLENENRGFIPQHLLTFRVSFAGKEARDPSQMAAYFDRMLARLKQVPGVKAVGAITNPPVEGYKQIGLYFVPQGSGPIDPVTRISAGIDLINPSYFKATGVPILRGREFGEHDQENAAPVAIISNALARRYFPGQNPVGKTLQVGSPGRAGDYTREIVGVAGDVRYLTRRAEDSIEIYMPFVQTTWPTVYVFVRTDGDAGRLAGAVRSALNQSGWRQPVSNLRTVEDWISYVNGKARLNSLLAAVFAAIALALAAIGIYGVISYSVVQRNKEIGIRMALGATPKQIRSWIVRQAVMLAAAGVAIGLAGHFALSRVLRSLLFGVSPNDVVTWLGAAAMLGVIAVAASYIPARRAMRSDPLAALRQE